MTGELMNRMAQLRAGEKLALRQLFERGPHWKYGIVYRRQEAMITGYMLRRLLAWDLVCRCECLRENSVGPGVMLSIEGQALAALLPPISRPNTREIA